MINLGLMPAAQAQAWGVLVELHQMVPGNWNAAFNVTQELTLHAKNSTQKSGGISCLFLVSHPQPHEGG